VTEQRSKGSGFFSHPQGEIIIEARRFCSDRSVMM